MTTPRVSVVIPAFNAEETLSATIESALGQSFDDIEVVVVDDGSTDGTAEIAHSYGKRVRCLSQDNLGVSEARNRGINTARSPYIALLDADDTWHTEKLEMQVSLLESDPSISGVYAGVVKVSPDGVTLDYVPAREFDDLSAALLLHSSVIPASQSSLLVRREIFDAVGGFDPAFTQCADWDFLIRASLKSRFAPVKDWLVQYRTGNTNMSRNIRLLESDTFAVLAKFFSTADSHRYHSIKPRVYSNHWLILSGSYLHDGQPTNAASCLVAALKHDPTNFRYPLSFPVRLGRRARDRFVGRLS